MSLILKFFPKEGKVWYTRGNQKRGSNLKYLKL